MVGWKNEKSLEYDNKIYFIFPSRLVILRSSLDEP